MDERALLNLAAMAGVPAARSIRRLASAVAALALALVPAATRADIFTWSGGGGDNSWSTASNWAGSVAPPPLSLLHDFHFGGTLRLTPFLQTAYSVNSLTFDAGAGAFTFSGNRLTIGGGGLTQNSASTQTINNAVTLAAQQTWTLNTGAGALNLGTTATIDNGGFSLTLNTAAGTSAMLAGTISGTGGLSKAGSGTVTLAGANTYSGNTNVTGGTLTLTSGASLTGSDVTVGSGATLNINGSIDTGGKNLFLDGVPANAATATLGPGGSVIANVSYAGVNGDGDFVQNGGTHSVTNALYLGYNTGSSGDYALSGGTLSTGSTVVGVFGSGSFTQTGGTHNAGASFLNLGIGAGSVGRYDLSGGTLSSLVTVVGNSGAGTFVQSGGSHVVDSGMYIGFDVGSTGTYDLTGGTLSSSLTYVGRNGNGSFSLGGSGSLSGGATVVGLGSGTGSFTQNGGMHALWGGVHLGYEVGSNGTYTLNSGIVSDDVLFVGVSGNGTFTQTGGSNSSRTYAIIGYSAGSSGDFNLSGGTFAPNDAYVGYSGTGTFDQTGGEAGINGLYVGHASGGTGTYNLNSGTLTTNVTMAGVSGTGAFNQSGGTHTIAPGSGLYLAYNASGTGSYNLSGGTLTTPLTYVGADGNGVFTQTGGNATSDFLVLGNSAGTTGSYHLNGGILTTTAVSQGSGVGSFNFNGGLVQAKQNSPGFMSGLSVANVRSGGARIDTNGFNVSITQPLLHDTNLGAPATDGGLFKLGNGTLTLAGANTYRGATTINGGTLALIGGLNGASGTALTFTGTGAFTVNQPAGTTQNMGVLTFSSGDGTVQSIWAGSGNTALIFSSLAPLAPIATANFVVSGGTNGTTNKIVLTGQPTGFIGWNVFFGDNEFAYLDSAGYVRAINYGVDPNTSLSSGGATLVGDHVKTTGTITDQGTERIETLHVAGNVTITMGSNKKLTTNAILKTGNVAGGATITSGTSIQSDPNVELLVRTLGVNDSLTINTPIIPNGTNPLIKLGQGTLTLAGANTYTGGTNVREGTLRIGANERLLNTGGLTISGGTFNLQTFSETVGAVRLASGSIIGTGAGTLTGSSYTMESGTASAILAGTAALTKNTAGTVTLSGVNTYTGGSTINAGTVVVNSAASLGALSGSLLLNAGTLEIATGFSSGRSITLGDATSTFQVDSAQTYTVSSGIIGSGALNKTGAGTMTLTGASSYSGGTDVRGGTLRLGANERLLNAGPLSIAGGTVDVQTFSETVGSVVLASGSINGTGAGTLVGSAFEVQSGSASAILAGAGGLAKTTSGTVTLTGANTYSGGTSVIGGTLRIGGDERLLNSGALTVAGGTFDVQTFSETVGAVVLANGTIEGTGTGKLTGSSFEVQNGTANAILAGSSVLTKTTTGTVTLNGANTYSGGTTVRAGTLLTGSNERLLNSGTLNVSGGTFDVRGFSETVGAVVLASGAINGNGTGTVTGSSFDVRSGSASAILAGNAALSKTTTSNVTLTGNNSYTGTTTVNGGTLTAAAGSGSALGGTLAVVVNANGNLALGASNQINDAAAMSLAGGRFSKGNYSEGSANGAGLGALNLTAAGSAIDFGAGTPGTLAFAIFNPGTFSLSVDNWTGTAGAIGDATTDRLIFASDPTPYLSSFVFSGYETGGLALLLGSGLYEVTPNLTPVPEINPAVCASLLCAVLGVFAHRQAVRKRQRETTAV